MRRSQYLEDYLDSTSGGRLITPGTYLAYTLRGRAKTYIGRYLGALLRALDAEPDVAPVRSVGGRTAYVRTPCATPSTQS